jgi:hypothetical protein
MDSDALFARLKARALHERVTLKQLLQRFVEQERVRLLCQPRVMGEAVQTPAQAAEVLRRFMAEPGVARSDSEVGAWEGFHALLLDQPNSPARQCTDANLAALKLPMPA